MTDRYDVFLSHSKHDERLVRKLADRIRSWNISVYVDFDDPALGQLMDKALADRLKYKIQQCQILVFAFSVSSATSKWMPWELGLAHGAVGRVILWPLDAKARLAASSQEYLSLYESINPKNSEQELRSAVAVAQLSSHAPAHLEAARNLAQGTMGNIDKFDQPEVFSEFVVNGPAKLYAAWLAALFERR